MKTLRTCSLEEKKLPGYQNNLLDLSSNLQVMPNWTFLSHYIINVNLKTGYLFNMVLHLASKQPDMFTHSFPSLTSMCGCHLCGRKLPSFLKTTIPPLSFEGQGNKVFRDHILITSLPICFTDYKELDLILELREV